MTIFDRIKQKANKALQGVGNFIDRDKQMGGVQLAQGGLGNRVSQFVQNNNPISRQNYQGSGLQRGIQNTTNALDRINQSSLGAPARFLFGDDVTNTGSPEQQNPGLLRAAFTRPFAEIPLSISEILGGDNKIRQQDPVGRTLFGNKPIQSYQESARTGGVDFLTDVGVPQQTAESLVPYMAVAGVALDATPPGLEDIGRKGASEVLPTALRRADEAAGFLKRADGADDLVKPLKTAKDTIFVNPGGTSIKPRVQPKTTASLDRMLQQASEAIPGGVQRSDDIGGLLTAGKQTPALPAGEIPRIRQVGKEISRLKKSISEVGDSPLRRQMEAKLADLNKEYARLKELDSLSPEERAFAKSVEENTFNTKGDGVPGKVGKFMSSLYDDTSQKLEGLMGDMHATTTKPLLDTFKQRLGEGIDYKRSIDEGLLNLGVKLKTGGKDDKLIRLFQKKDGYNKVAAKVGKQRADELKRVYDYAREVFEDVFPKINEARRAAGLNELSYKEGGFLSQVGSGGGKSMWDAILTGDVETISRVDPRSSAIFKKQGKNTDMGVVESLLRYVDYANMARFNDISAKEATDLAGQLGKSGAPREVVEALIKFSDRISGSTTSDLNRIIDQATALPKAAATIGKFSTVPNQFLGVVQGAVDAGPGNFAKGLTSKETSQAVKQSNLLKSTGYRTPAKLRGGNMYKKVVGRFGDVAQSAQQATNNVLFRAFHQQALKKGLSGDEAVKYADDLVTTIVGDRRVGMSPDVYETAFGKIFGAFTIEPTASMRKLGSQTKQAFKGDPKVASKVAGTVIGMHLVNNIWERAGAGYRPYPDLPQAAMTAHEYFTGSDEKEKNDIKAAGVLLSELMQTMPVLNNVFNTAYAGGQAMGMLPNSGDVFGANDNTWMNPFNLYAPTNWDRNITGNKLADVPLNLAGKYLPGFEQPARSLQAGISLARGHAETKDGSPMYQMPDNLFDQGRALLFGQSSTPQAQEFFDSDFTPFLSDKQKEMFDQMPDKDSRLEFLKNAQAKNKSDNRLDSILDGGRASVTQDDMKTAIFNGKSADSDKIQDRMDVYKELNTILTDDEIPDSYKQAALEASGAKKEDVDYYIEAAKDLDVKMQETILPTLDAMADDEEMMTFLMAGRKEIGDKQLVTSDMIEYLYDREYLDKNQKEALKSLKWDQIKEEFYYDRDYDGGSGSGKMSYKQALKVFSTPLPKFSRLKSIDLLSSINTSTSQTNQSGEKLLSNILNSAPKQPGGGGNRKLWFNT